MKFSQYLLMLAFLLLLLGAGNVYIGQKRALEYEKLLFEYNQEAISLNLSKTEISKNSLVSKESKTPVINKKNLDYLQARHGFYRFCTLGGKCFLALAAICMISALLVKPSSDEASLTA